MSPSFQPTSLIISNGIVTVKLFPAFAGNLHSRFPVCVVGAIVAFDKSQITTQVLNEMYSILTKVVIRTSPTDQDALLEGFGIIVYQCDPFRLVPNTPPPKSPFRWNNLFDKMVELVVKRYVPLKYDTE